MDRTVECMDSGLENEIIMPNQILAKEVWDFMIFKYFER